MSHCGFGLHSPNDQGVEHLSHVLFGHFCIFFGEISVELLGSFMSWAIYLFIIGLYEFFVCATC